MAVLLKTVTVFFVRWVLSHVVHSFDYTGHHNSSDVVKDQLHSNHTCPVRVEALIVFFDIPPSAHECYYGQSFFSAEASIKLTVPKSFVPRIQYASQANSFVFRLTCRGKAAHSVVILNNTNVTNIYFKRTWKNFYSLHFQYGGKIGKYPDVGLVQTSCSGERWPKQSPIVTYYGKGNTIQRAASIIPDVLIEKNDYPLTVCIRKRMMQRIVFSSSLSPSSTESGAMIQTTYKAPLPLHKIIFAIGYFIREAGSEISKTTVRVLSTRKTMPYILGFVMNEAREMISAMEENFGESLIDTDLCFLVVSGTNIIKADPFFAVIGIENPRDSSPFLLWKLIRESVVMKWFGSITATSNERMIIDGLISYLVGSLLGVRTTKNGEGWVSIALSEQLRNALPLEHDERASYGGIETQFSVTSPAHAVEVITNLIGKRAMNEALYNFLQDVRQKRNSSLLKTLENAFRRRKKKNWCGRPFNVTDFFIQWTAKPWPKSGVSITKFLLHVYVNKRNDSSKPSSKSVPSGSPYKGKSNYPPVPLLLSSLNESNESVIWKSNECGIVFSGDKKNVMTLIKKGDIILRVGSPRQLRITYEESGLLGYPTLLSTTYSQKAKVSTNDQLTFAADRLHFLLAKRWLPDYIQIIHLMDAFLKNSEDTAMFILFWPIINELYRTMAGTHREPIFIKYVHDLLEMQYSSFWWWNAEYSENSLRRRMFFPFTVQWSFEMSRENALGLFNESFSKGNPLNPENHRLVELAESAFCAAVIHNVRYFYFFLEKLTEATDELRERDYLYDEITRSLACTTDEAAIRSLVDALFSGLESEDRREFQTITAKQYINALGGNVLSMDSMLDRLLKNESVAHMLHDAHLLRPYLSAMTRFCYTHQCLEKISQLHSRIDPFVTEIQGIFSEYSDSVFRRTTHVQSIIDHMSKLYISQTS